MHQLNILVNNYHFRFRQIFNEILKVFANIFNYSKPLVVDLLITNDQQMRTISKTTRNLDKTTDVLSFPFAWNCADWPFIHLGEIILSYQQIQHQARLFNHTVKREFCFLFAHGLVHLAGLDHKDPSEEAKFNQFVYNIMKAVDVGRETKIKC